MHSESNISAFEFVNNALYKTAQVKVMINHVEKYCYIQ